MARHGQEEGQGVEDRGKEPSTQASIFSVTGDKFTVEMSGQGVLDAGAKANTEDGPEIQVSPARMMERKYYVFALGGVLSALVRSGLPVACMSNGSCLPEDLHAARPQWLVARAVELARAAGSGIDAEYLAQHLGGELHAAA